MATLERDTHDTQLERIGRSLIRLTLALIFITIGAMKFTAYEAAGIRPFVENSPLISWWYDVLGVREAAGVLGVLEIAIGLLLLYGFIAERSRAALIGALLSAATYLVTLTFIASTPGAFTTENGIPLLSAEIGQFLAKDMVLLAASLYLAGRALRARARRQTPSPA